MSRGNEDIPLLEVLNSNVPFANPFVFETIMNTELEKPVVIEWLVLENCDDDPNNPEEGFHIHGPSTRFVKTWSRVKKCLATGAKMQREVQVRDYTGGLRVMRLDSLWVPPPQLGDYEIRASDIPGRIVKRTCVVEGCEWMMYRGVCRNHNHIGRATVAEVEAIGIDCIKVPANPEFSFNCEENGIIDVNSFFVALDEDLEALESHFNNPNPAFIPRLVDWWWKSRPSLKEVVMALRARRGFPVYKSIWTSLPV